MENKNEWRKVKLSELMELKYGKEHKKLLSGSIPCYGTGGIIRFVNTSIYEEESVLIPRKGSLKNIYYIDTPFWTVDTLFWTKINKEVVVPKFLYYKLKNCDLSSLDEGTAIPSLTTKTLNEIKIEIPSLNIQKKIAKILSDIDNKIELNEKINDNLEKQAHLIFNNHFFNKNKNYNNYIFSNLLEIADFLNGLAMQKYTPDKSDEKNFPILKIKELNQGFTDKSSDRCSSKIKPEYIIKNGDIIFSWSGTLLIKIWCGNKCGLNQHLFKVTSKKYDKWFYFLWTNYHLKKFISIAKDKVTTMGHIKRTDLEKSFVLIPPEKEYKNLNKILTPIFESIISNKKENNYLKHLKNYLLPKLMNGEINVENIEL